jgi:hydrogenase expression/formation protein HypC
VPGELVAIDRADDGRLFGLVDFGGIRKQVSLDCLTDARVGEMVLVHVGFAIGRIDRDEAERTLELLRSIGEVS